MEKPEDTSDHIRDFLKGRLAEPEAEAFRQRMAQDPELEDRVAFARLLLGGLQEIGRQKKRLRRRWALAVSLCIALLTALAWHFISEKKPAPPVPQPPPTQSVGDEKTGSADNPAIGMGGGASPEGNSDRASSIAWNSRGEAIVGGQFSGEARFGKHLLAGFGKGDIFLAACSHPGTSDELQFGWARQFGSAAGEDLCEKIAVDGEDNILLTGSFFTGAHFDGQTLLAIGNGDNGSGDFFVAKLDPRGRLLWLDHGGGNAIANVQTGSNLGLAIAADPAGNVIATGRYLGTPVFGGKTLPPGGANEDLFLAKYDPAGKLIWVKTATGDPTVFANGMDTDRQGNIFLTGVFGHHNLGGSAVFDGVKLESRGGRDLFVAKYFLNGKLAWVRRAGSANQNGRDFGQTIRSTPDGSCVVTGFFEGVADFGEATLTCQGDRDAFLAKYSSEGKLLWAMSFGGEKNDMGNGVCLDREGNIYCTGHFSGTARFGIKTLASIGSQDIFTAKFDSLGRLLWLRQFGGDSDNFNSDSAHEIMVNRQGELVVTGFFSGKMHIGNRSLTSNGREDVFLLFFDENGELLRVRQVVVQL